MLSTESLSKLRDLAEEVSAREACKLYDLEFKGTGGNRTLRIFIESLEGNVSIDQCANVSNALSLLLDVHDIIPGDKYELEVSSPGLERQLNQDWHYEQAIGQNIKVRTKEIVFPVGQEPNKKSKIKQVIGELLGIENDSVLVKDENNEWKIGVENIHKANVVFELNKNKKIKHKR